MTQAWVRLVDVKLKIGGGAENADAFCEREAQLMQKTCLESFYSRHRLFTWEAKRGYVEPDLRAFA